MLRTWEYGGDQVPSWVSSLHTIIYIDTQHTAQHAYSNQQPLLRLPSLPILPFFPFSRSEYPPCDNDPTQYDKDKMVHDRPCDKDERRSKSVILASNKLCMQEEEEEETHKLVM